MIYFETSFKAFSESVSDTICSVNEFWSNIQKKGLDLIKAEKVSGTVLKHYQRYYNLYHKMNEECGEILIVENMAWKLN